MARSLSFVFENEDADDVTVNDTVVNGEMESNINELQDENDSITEIGDNIDSALEDTSELEDIEDVMEDSVENGDGLSEDAAKIAEVAIESICDRLGVPVRSSIMPAMESFGSTNSRLAATRIALEGIGEHLVNAWKAIKRAYNAMIDRIKAFLKRVFDQNIRMQRATKAVESKVDSLGSKKPRESAFESATIFKAFAVGNRVDSGTVETILNNHMTATHKSMEVIDDMTDVVNVLNEIISDTKKEGTNKQELEKKITDALKNITLPDREEGEYTTSTPQLVGGKRILLQTVVRSDNDIKSYVKVYEKGLYDATNPTNVSVPVLKPKEISNILSLINKLAVLNDTIKTKSNGLNKIEKTVNAVIDKAIKTVDKLEGESGDMTDRKETLSVARKALAEIGNGTGKIASNIPAINLAACKAGLSYVEACIRMYRDSGK